MPNNLEAKFIESQINNIKTAETVNKIFNSLSDESKALFDYYNIDYNERLFSNQNIKEYLKSLRYSYNSQDKLLTIYATTRSPLLSKEIAKVHTNIIVKEYSLEKKRLLDNYNKLLTLEVENLKSKIANIESNSNIKNYNSYKKQDDAVVERLSLLNKRLVAANTERIQYEKLINISNKKDFINDKEINNIKKELNKTKAELQLLSKKLGPKHPKMKAMNAKIENFNFLLKYKQRANN